jgi:hypothetical protein
VEGFSLLKKPLGARFGPKWDTCSGFGAFGTPFVVAIGPMPTLSAGWSFLRTSLRDGVFGSPVPAHTESGVKEGGYQEVSKPAFIVVRLHATSVDL